MGKKFIVIFLLFLSVISFGEEFKGSYEEGYIEINVNKKIKYSFFPIYMDYSLEEPYVGVMNLFALTMARGMKIDRGKKMIYGRMGEADYKFYYGDTKYITGENDVYIRGNDLSQIFKLASYEWNTETYLMKIKTKFKTPYEIYLEQEERLKGLGADGEEDIDERDVYSQERKLFTPGVLRPRYSNFNVEDEEGTFSARYETHLLYGDFSTTGFIHPDAYFGYTALRYNEILGDKSIIVGDANMQTYEFLGSKRLTGIAIQDWNGAGNIEVGQTSIRGFAPYNSNVELYRNGSLYDFARVGEDGSYVFENINIQGYSDIYTIKIYNFDGSIEVKQISMMSANKILKKGKVDYGLLIGTHRDMNEEEEVIDIEEKPIEGNIQASYGLTNNLTMGFDYINNLTEKRVGSDNYNFPTELIGLDLYYTTGAVKYPTYFEFSEIYDIEHENDENRYSHIGKVRQRFGGNVLSLEGYMYNDFTAFLESYQNRYIADWRGVINNYLGYNLRYDNIDRFGFIEEYGSAGIYQNKNRVSHELGVSYPFSEEYGTSRAYYNYSNSNIEIYDTNLNFIFQIDSDFQDFEEETKLKVALKTAENKKFRGGIFLKYNSKDEYEAGLEARYKVYSWIEIVADLIHDEEETNHNIGVDMEKTIILEKPFTSNSNPSPDRSWMEGKVFMDDNNNGKHDEGEALLEGVEVKVGRKKGITGTDGLYFIDDISSYEVEDFEVNIETLDPMLEPANEKKHIKLYPATGGHMDIPIQVISVIMGDLEFRGDTVDGVKYFPIISQLYVQLKTLDGKVVMEKRLEPEGFFMLEKVLPGEYILEMDYRGEGQLNFEEKSKKLKIKLDKYGSYYEDYNFKVISYEKD
ncbi:fimbria/pilus outer membrane usher protein [Psychrilyobacter atlanticus]|uniref:fimbria/pilus outer membrane usher protein n=1 Tax=Psychrilyobacter atlanticus TaxID=271091 RepID=UPI00042514AC|nr:fimbria/pilus outer membrane usher protein [Psychrilyobacter atlanticus]